MLFRRNVVCGIVLCFQLFVVILLAADQSERSHQCVSGQTCSSADESKWTDALDEALVEQSEDELVRFQDVRLLQRSWNHAHYHGGRDPQPRAPVARTDQSSGTDVDTTPALSHLEEKRLDLLAELQQINREIGDGSRGLPVNGARHGEASQHGSATAWVTLQNSTRLVGSDIVHQDALQHGQRVVGVGHECLWSFSTLALQLKLDSLRAMQGFPQRAPCSSQELHVASETLLPKKAASFVAEAHEKLHKTVFLPASLRQDAFSVANHWFVVCGYGLAYLLTLLVIWLMAEPRVMPEPHIESRASRAAPLSSAEEERSGISSILRKCFWHSNVPSGGAALPCTVSKDGVEDCESCELREQKSLTPLPQAASVLPAPAHEAEEEQYLCDGVFESTEKDLQFDWEVQQWARQRAAAAFAPLEPCQLGASGWESDASALQSAALVEHFWSEQVKDTGHSASLFKVVARICPWSSILSLMILACCRTLAMQVVSVLLVEHALNYVHWLQEQHRLNEAAAAPDLTLPLLVGIIAFSMVPLASALFGSAMSYVSKRLDQRLCGGFSVALFKKSLRLPGGCHCDIVGNPAACVEKRAAGSKDVAQLVHGDVHSVLQGVCLHFCLCLNSLVAIVLLTGLLWHELRLAAIAVLGCGAIVVCAAFVTSCWLSRGVSRFKAASHLRVSALREVLLAIRAVKCCGWEDVATRKIESLRENELGELGRYHRLLGIVVGLLLASPRLLILAGLWTYAAVYGQHDVTTVFVCLQILTGLKGSCEVMAQSLTRLLQVPSSLRRIEEYLKLPELAPVSSGQSPEWVELWPESGREPPAGSSLRVKGSFYFPTSAQTGATMKCASSALSEQWSPVLTDLTLYVPRGQLVAIVGHVGAGKSALLRAVLGEMHPASSPSPCSPSRISRPAETIAYCQQVPHIAEGTIQDNILFGEAYDEERYQEALRCAGLDADLKTFPCGDRTHVGGAAGFLGSAPLPRAMQSRIALARAAYCTNSRVALIDDPFQGMSVSMAEQLVDDLLNGSLMQGRTRLVVLQPERTLLQKFDHIIVLATGQIREEGSADTVARCAAFPQLDISSDGFNLGEGDSATLQKPSPSSEACSENSSDAGGQETRARRKSNKWGPLHTMHARLMDEKLETRLTWTMVARFLRIGRWRNLSSCALFFFLQMLAYLLCDLSLAVWTNDIASGRALAHPRAGAGFVSDRDWRYLRAYFLWFVTGCVAQAISWQCGTWFSLRISKEVHDISLQRIMRAPLELFFDQRFAGRLAIWFGADLASLDVFMLMRGTSVFATACATALPLIYAHAVLPVFVTTLSVPLYCLLWQLFMAHRDAASALRRRAGCARAEVSSFIAEVAGSGTAIRAYGHQERVARALASAVGELLQAEVVGERMLRQWLTNRLLLLWSFCITTAFIVALTTCARVGAGTLGLCLTSLLLLGSLIEPNIEWLAGAQSASAALGRMHSCMTLPSEKQAAMPHEDKYCNFTACIKRADSGQLTLAVAEDELLELTREKRCILRELPGQNAFGVVLDDGAPWASAFYKNSEHAPELLRRATQTHQLVSVNGVSGDVHFMAEELCYGVSADVVCELRSPWLTCGGSLQVEDLSARYPDGARDALKSVNLTIAPRSRVGLTGASGAGKTSLLYVLLRVLEPRVGRVLLNGVETREVSTATWRHAVAMVPEEPVLFSGTLKQNLDPDNQYPIAKLWAALHAVHLGALVGSWPSQLDHLIAADTSSLSKGLRQLVCLAQMVLRQPALLLADGLETVACNVVHHESPLRIALSEAFEDTTVIVASHRLKAVLELLDQIVVLDQGRVQLVRTTNELVPSLNKQQEIV